ncbi:hypothetical protein [Agrobacterium tumefaciens]|uniref:hypothetical protein n=1 Tax=Agrobacterium tumefaciens TaxID=358 RepID=UPI0015733A44|nr:hypothetical protein [Agrobacterium tumefaciens]NTD11692.1 hypothetical protein [Agrobacterium tumefaciens]
MTIGVGLPEQFIGPNEAISAAATSSAKHSILIDLFSNNIITQYPEHGLDCVKLELKPRLGLDLEKTRRLDFQVSGDGTNVSPCDPSSDGFSRPWPS